METPESELHELAKKLGTRLLMKRLRLATAESCTGGWVAKVLTDIAGSSDWYDCTIVSYSYDAKRRLLSVPEATLVDHGAVSENAIMAMQLGLFINTSADAGISISGIAGPGGGSADKPVGTVWIAASLRDRMVQTQKFAFDGDRNEVRWQAVEAALKMILDIVERA